MKEHWGHLSPIDATQVVVAWRDIQEVSAWNEDEPLVPVHLETIGWLLYEGADPQEAGSKILIIAKTYDHNDRRWADYTVFPLAVVKEVRHCEKPVDMDTSGTGRTGNFTRFAPEAWLNKPEGGGEDS